MGDELCEHDLGALPLPKGWTTTAALRWAPPFSSQNPRRKKWTTLAGKLHF